MSQCMDDQQLAVTWNTYPHTDAMQLSAAELPSVHHTIEQQLLVTTQTTTKYYTTTNYYICLTAFFLGHPG